MFVYKYNVLHIVNCKSFMLLLHQYISMSFCLTVLLTCFLICTFWLKSCWLFLSMYALYTCKYCHATHLLLKNCFLTIGMNVEDKWCSWLWYQSKKSDSRSYCEAYHNTQDHFSSMFYNIIWDVGAMHFIVHILSIKHTLNAMWCLLFTDMFLHTDK